MRVVLRAGGGWLEMAAAAAGLEERRAVNADDAARFGDWTTRYRALLGRPCGCDAGQPTDMLERAIDDFVSTGVISIASERQVDCSGEHAAGVEAGVNGEEMTEARKEESSANEEHETDESRLPMSRRNQ